ncbi:hypothetical protein [Streptomyces sp. AC550_RSS872]|uniref:hypothetical protein n=1 Tax=Streptomyces sp. AC550_RSS872 TaxID=2823689 RepID=UPI001C25AD20|nr:hypothetical protein [Streptomyces sp. AC550_RSS872]
MGDALDIMQVAGVGAAALVTEMVKNTWESVRDSVARFFQRGGEESAEQELRLIDTARQRLVGSAEGERASVEEQLRSQLMIQLAAFLQKHPDTAQELQNLADQVQEADEGSRARTSVHGNTNSQVVIAGGAINASGGFHYRTPEGGR